jgi:hypothetical protein
MADDALNEEERQLLEQEVFRQPHSLLFVTVSGAHLYGFPSPNSDFDLRGVHLLPLRDVIGLYDPQETIEVSHERKGREIDLVTHDIGKFMSLMMKRNGYVLEQLYSPFVVHSTPEYSDLLRMGKGCITRHHSHHYLGFASTQWNLLEKQTPYRIKPLLYVFRTLLTGIHLMRTGEVEANLVKLNAIFQLSYLDDLIAQKRAEAEEATLQTADLRFFRAEYERLIGELEEARRLTDLPDQPTTRAALNDLLIRLRLKTEGSL